MAAGVVDRVTLAEAIESDALQAMRCPVCTSLHTAIRKSDPLANGTVNRYRTCRNCGKRFTTNHAETGPLPRAERLRAAAMTEKRCVGCKTVKPVTAFGKKENDQTLYRSKCRQCLNRARAEHGLKRSLEKHGLTDAEYRTMFESQAGKCAICGSTGKGKGQAFRPLCIDHDHQTGTVRGLLCDKCNLGIGNFNDDTSRLQSAVAYLIAKGGSSGS